MLPDRVSNPGPLTYESGALPIALRGPADSDDTSESDDTTQPTTSASTPRFLVIASRQERQVASLLLL